ncbi:MAG: cobalamin biosynthesis protein, partial [Proteobacteria bacterium]|nr:cobalamin biosynthesis protein [Pseudomonadota bacterium]
DTAQTLGVDIDYFNKDQLNGAQGTKPSALVRHHMGVDSVCEAAALLASQGGTLLVPKNKTPRVTCAVAVSLS